MKIKQKSAILFRCKKEKNTENLNWDNFYFCLFLDGKKSEISRARKTLFSMF